MADDRNKTGGSDRSRVNVNQDYQVRGWAKRPGTSPEALKDAVKGVGDRIADVRTRLAGGRKPARRSEGSGR
jgi:hypothetical protein